MSIPDQTERLQRWLTQSCLPLWANAGVDSQCGGFFELLSFDGEPLAEQRKRMRVQARQLYTYSHAALLGYGDAERAARSGFDFLTAHYWHADGGWIFSTARDGSDGDRRRETYEQAFALLGLSWYFNAFRDQRALPWIEQTLTFLDQLRDPQHGGFRESVPDKLPRRQNPHMHLLEAFLALYRIFGEQRYMDQAEQIVELAVTHFIEHDAGTLGEYFDAAWQRAPGTAGEILEPGHHFEWVWLLRQYAAADGRRGAQSLELARALFASAERQRDADTGLSCNEIHRSGQISDGNKRLWPQTEALKAHLALAEADPSRAPDPGHAEQIIAAMFRYYLRDNGTWQDVLDADDRGVGDSAPASTLYHLFVAFDAYLSARRGSDYRLD